MKSSRAKNINELHEEFIMGFKVQFFDYIQIITLFEEIFVYQCYRFTCDHGIPLIIDCGSNIGVSVFYFKILFPNATVLCFEPDPVSFELMQTNFRQNQLQDVTCYNLALAESAGTVKLYKSSVPPSSGMSLISTHTSYEEIVEAKKLSAFIQQDVDLVKIDVEGSEIQILRDLYETGRYKNIRQMVIEFHPSKTKMDIKDSLNMLADHDFDFHEREDGHKGTDKVFFFKNK